MNSAAGSLSLSIKPTGKRKSLTRAFVPFSSLLLFSLGLGLLTSCFREKHREETSSQMLSQPNNPTSHDQPLSPDLATIEKPIIFDIADKHCMSPLQDMGMTKVWLWNDSKLQLTDIDLRGFSGRGLRSDIIREVRHRMIFEVIERCETATPSESHSCSSKYKEIYEGELLNFCQSGGYPKNSAENVALATVAGISLTHKLQKRVQPLDKIEPITVYVHPQILNKKFENDNEKPVESYITDNIFWNHRKSKGYIAVLPPSNEKMSSYDNGVFLWEMSPVISHEFGHHLFFNYAPTLALLGSELRLSATAINESVADHISFLTYETEHQSLGELNLEGQKLNRMVSSEECDDGWVKSLEEWFLHHFFHNPRTEMFISPLSPDPQDTHALGAVLAHVNNALFLEKVGHLTDPQAGVEGKYALLVRWIRSLEADFPEDKKYSPHEFIEKSALKAIELAKVDNHLSHKQCSILYGVLPVFWPSWKDMCPNFEGAL